MQMKDKQFDKLKINTDKQYINDKYKILKILKILNILNIKQFNINNNIGSILNQLSMTHNFMIFHAGSYYIIIFEGVGFLPMMVKYSKIQFK